MPKLFLNNININLKLVFILFTLIPWITIVIFGNYYHEYWRDEVRALSIAMEATHWWNLFSGLKNEGHPGLWHLMLYIAVNITHSSISLPLVSGITALISVSIFLLKSPFNSLTKFLFTFSLLPIYEYSVMARNYGISMLLMFCYSMLITSKKNNNYIISLILSLLANTNIHSFIISFILGIYWISENFSLFNDKKILNIKNVLPIFIWMGGLLIALMTMLPDSQSVVIQTDAEGFFQRHITTFATFLKEPWIVFPSQYSNLDIAPPILKLLVMLLFLWGLASSKKLMLCLIFINIFFGYIFSSIYPPSLRHQGLLLICTLCIYWISLKQSNRSKANHLVSSFLIPIVLGIGCFSSYKSIKNEMVSIKSSNKALGDWISENQIYKDAILIGEPDYLLESLPYYSNNPLFKIRENKFGNVVKFTKDTKEDLTLHELIQGAETIQKLSNGTPVLLILGFPISINGGNNTIEDNRIINYSYNRKLIISEGDTEKLKKNTIYLKSFRNSSGDENYDVYLLQSNK